MSSGGQRAGVSKGAGDAWAPVMDRGPAGARLPYPLPYQTKGGGACGPTPLPTYRLPLSVNVAIKANATTAIR